MDLEEALEALRRKIMGEVPIAPSGPAQIGQITVRPASRVEEVARVPAAVAEDYAQSLRRTRGMDSFRSYIPPVEDPNRPSNQEMIRRANEALALSRNAGTSDAELDARIEAEHGPKSTWKEPAPTAGGTAMYEDLLAAARQEARSDAIQSVARAGARPIPGAPAPASGAPAAKPLQGPTELDRARAVLEQARGPGPGPVAIEQRVPQAAVRAAASPEQKTQAAPGGGALGAEPAKAAMEMALAAIPSPDVRALLADRLKLAKDGDAELRAAQQREAQLTSLAGLQRQLGQAAAILGGERYDDTGAAAAERSAGLGTRGVMAQRGLQEKAAQGALDITGQMERERSARAGEALDARRLGEMERHNRAGEQLGWYEARTARARAMKDGAAYDKEVQKLAKEVGGNVAIGAEKLREIDSALREQGIGGIDDTGTKRDLQGAGPVTNLATRLTGNLFVSDKGARLRNSVVDLAAIILYLRTGKAANRAEAETVARSFGLAPGSSEQEFRQGIQRMRDEFAARSKQAEAGFSPGAVQTFEARGGTTAGKLGEIGRKPITRTVGGETRTWNGSAWVK